MEGVTLILPDGRKIVVTYVCMTGQEKIRLSFDAPADVGIYRNEICPPAGGEGARGA